jgi:peptide/nickel transport system permease protein
VLLALLVAAALAAPLYAERVAHTTPSDNHLSERITVDGEETNVVSLTGEPIGPTWSGEFLLGADENGRDLAVRLLYGLRATLEISGAAVLLTLAFAIPMALMAGYFGGRTDALIARLLDLIWSFPALLLGVMLGTALSLQGASIGPIEIESGSRAIPIVVIGLVFIPYAARPLRGQVLELRGREFVDAARLAGASPVRLMGSELLPHLIPSVLILTGLLLANSIVLEAALSFLGAGVDPPEPSIGSLIDAGVDTVRLSPHLLLVPCVALVLVVLAIGGIAEGLRRALDPRGELPRGMAAGS